MFAANVRDLYTALLVLVAGKAGRVHKLTNYIPSIVEQLLKLARCAARRCKGHATVSTERGKDRRAPFLAIAPNQKSLSNYGCMEALSH